MRFDGYRFIDGFVFDCYSISGIGILFVFILFYFYICYFYGRQKVFNLFYMFLKVYFEVDQLIVMFNQRGKVYVDIISKFFCYMMVKGRIFDEFFQDFDIQVIVDFILVL